MPDAARPIMVKTRRSLRRRTVTAAFSCNRGCRVWSSAGARSVSFQPLVLRYSQNPATICCADLATRRRQEGMMYRLLAMSLVALALLVGYSFREPRMPAQTVTLPHNP